MAEENNRQKIRIWAKNLGKKQPLKEGKCSVWMWLELTSLVTCRLVTVVPVSTAPGLGAATAAICGLPCAAWAACTCAAG